jgi:hypothetical protein
VGLKGTVVVDLLWIRLLVSELWIVHQCLFFFIGGFDV